MKAAEPGMLVLAGQGHGGGVEFRTIKLDLGRKVDRFADSAYPRSELVDGWASLTTEIIPQEHNELVLVISRYADQDEVPWAYVAEYAKANLQGQRRNNHYSGVGLAIRASIIPDRVVDLIHEIHTAMITELLPRREFEQPMLDWNPPESVLQQISQLEFEPLVPGFGGIQPGRSLARVLYSRSVDGLVSKAQTDMTYSNFSAVVLSSVGGGATKDVYVWNERGIQAWVRANSPSEPSSRSSRPAEFEESPNDYTRGVRGQEKRDVIAQLRNDLKVLENQVLKLKVDVNNLQRNHQIGPNARSSSSAMQWGLFVLLLYLASVGTVATLKYVLSPSAR